MSTSIKIIVEVPEEKVGSMIAAISKAGLSFEVAVEHLVDHRQKPHPKPKVTNQRPAAAILDYLKRHPQALPDIAAALNLSSKKVSNALYNLKRKNLVVNKDRIWGIK